MACAAIPAFVSMTRLRPEDGATVSLVGVEGTLLWEAVGSGFVVEVPEASRDQPPTDYAWVFKISGFEPPDGADRENER